MLSRVCRDSSVFISLIFFWVLPISSAQAKVIEQKLDNGVVATAEFHQGDAEAPAILVLHGFLQTRESHTVARLYSALVDSGYTVLAPTLSLGISRRNQSLACEAVHSHTMQSDTAEIDMWSKWLSKKTSSKVILIGHSAGSVHEVAYLNEHKYDHISQGVFISLGYFGVAPASNETEEDGQRARGLLKQGKQSLDKYGLSYCKEYVTTPEKYLSYYVWQPQKMIEALKIMRVPVSVIIGNDDQRISKTWVQSMQDNGVNVILVPGAGHFFNNEYEFDLHDTVESVLEAN